MLYFKQNIKAILKLPLRNPQLDERSAFMDDQPKEPIEMSEPVEMVEKSEITEPSTLQPKKKGTKAVDNDYFALCLCFGVTFGIIFKNLAIGIALGVAIGLGLNNSNSKKNKR